MDEPRRVRLPLIALVIAIAILVLLVVLRWTKSPATGPGPDLLGPPLVTAGDDLGPPLQAHRNAGRPPVIGEGSTLPVRESAAELPPDGRGGLNWRRPEEPSDDLLEDRTGSLVVELGRSPLRDGESDRRYLLVMIPLTGLDAWTQSRLVTVEGGLNTIDGLPAVDWACRLVGERTTETIEIKADRDARLLREFLKLASFRPLRVEARSPDGLAISGLRLLQTGRALEGEIPPLELPALDAKGRTTFLCGPDEDGLLLAAPGWLPEDLEAARETVIELAADPSARRDRPVTARFRRPSARLLLRLLSETAEAAPLLTVRAFFVAGDSDPEVLSRAQGRRAGDTPIAARLEERGLVLDLPPETVGRLFVAAKGLRSEGRIEIETGPAGSEQEFEVRLVASRSLRGKAVAASYREYRSWTRRRVCYGPLDDWFTRIRPTRLGGYLIENASRDRFGIGRFERSDSSGATMVWPGAKSI